MKNQFDLFLLFLISSVALKIILHDFRIYIYEKRVSNIGKY
jgi:hypothetical protein